MPQNHAKMTIGIINELHDARVALVPDVVQQLTKEHNEVIIEKGAGVTAFFNDSDFEAAGAEMATRQHVLEISEMIISLSPLANIDASLLKPGTILISSYQPFADMALLNEISKFPVTVLSLDMIPRITIAQAMDVLSSMASVAGYKAVLLAANLLPRYFPMLTTAAGSIPPAKILVLGAGVAGLQAVATAKRLGAVVEAFDTRAAAKEEVQSLGAKFVEVEGAKDDKAAGGYAVEQTEEFKQKQGALVHEKALKADVIIATAQIRGRKAPTIIKKETVAEMKPGSIIIDLAASTGGNCELTEDNKTVVKHGVTIIGNSELAAGMPMHASQLFSKNVYNYLKVFLKEGQANLDLNHEILKSSCILFEGKVLFEKKV